MNASDQLGRRERLDDIVIGSHFECPGDEIVLAVRGHEYDRHVALIGDVFHEIDSVDARQHEVKEHDCRSLFGQKMQHIFRVAGNEYGVAFLDQGVPDVSERLGVVIHHQYACGFPIRPSRGLSRRNGGCLWGDEPRLLDGRKCEGEARTQSRTVTLRPDASSVRLDYPLANG